MAPDAAGVRTGGLPDHGQRPVRTRPRTAPEARSIATVTTTMTISSMPTVGQTRYWTFWVSIDPTPPAPMRPRTADARTLTSNRYSQIERICGDTLGHTDQRICSSQFAPTARPASSGPESAPWIASKTSFPSVPIEWIPIASAPVNGVSR